LKLRRWTPPNKQGCEYESYPSPHENQVLITVRDGFVHLELFFILEKHPGEEKRHENYRHYDQEETKDIS
jgi:hypothetical protein